MMTVPNAAPKNIATTDATLLANLGLLPFAIEESAPPGIERFTDRLGQSPPSFRCAARGDLPIQTHQARILSGIAGPRWIEKDQRPIWSSSGRPGALQAGTHLG